jgi:hypothetical protein
MLLLQIPGRTAKALNLRVTFQHPGSDPELSYLTLYKEPANSAVPKYATSRRLRYERHEFGGCKESITGPLPSALILSMQKWSFNLSI